MSNGNTLIIGRVMRRRRVTRLLPQLSHVCRRARRARTIVVVFAFNGLVQTINNGMNRYFICHVILIAVNILSTKWLFNSTHHLL